VLFVLSYFLFSVYFDFKCSAGTVHVMILVFKTVLVSAAGRSYGNHSFGRNSKWLSSECKVEAVCTAKPNSRVWTLVLDDICTGQRDLCPSPLLSLEYIKLGCCCTLTRGRRVAECRALHSAVIVAFLKLDNALCVLIPRWTSPIVWGTGTLDTTFRKLAPLPVCGDLCK
jgi:hypothetical protein